MPDTDADALRDLERRRCAAIAAADGDALRALLTPDYVHVHMTGKIDDIDGHIEAIVSRPRAAERGPLTIRLHGDAAVIVGDQTNIVGDQRSTAVAQQLAVRQDGRWRFAAMQLTPKKIEG